MYLTFSLPNFLRGLHTVRPSKFVVIILILFLSIKYAHKSKIINNALKYKFLIFVLGFSID